MPDQKDDTQLSATPSDEDVRRWQALSRDEQLARMKRIFAEADAQTPGTLSMQDIREAALSRPVDGSRE